MTSFWQPFFLLFVKNHLIPTNFHVTVHDVSVLDTGRTSASGSRNTVTQEAKIENCTSGDGDADAGEKGDRPKDNADKENNKKGFEGDEDLD
jgi:hypothetical protein